MLKNWCLTFFDKEKYVLHYDYLQLYLRLGLKHKEIHRVLESNQSQCRIQHKKKNKTRKTW